MKKLLKNKKLIISLVILLILIIIILVLSKSTNKEQKYELEISDKIKIRYAYNLGIKTVESLNEQQPYLDILEIKPNKDELNDIKKVLKKHPITIKEKQNNTYISGIYELTIDNQVILFDYDEGLSTKDNKNFKSINIPIELFDLISDIVFIKTEENQELLQSDNINITYNNETYNITDQSEIENILNSIRYTKINYINDEVSTPLSTINLNNIIIDIYPLSNTGKITNYNTNEEYYILLMTNPIEAIENTLSHYSAMNDLD